MTSSGHKKWAIKPTGFKVLKRSNYYNVGRPLALPIAYHFLFPLANQLVLGCSSPLCEKLM
jgi:hypothetical protein